MAYFMVDLLDRFVGTHIDAKKLAKARERERRLEERVIKIALLHGRACLRCDAAQERCEGLDTFDPREDALKRRFDKLDDKQERIRVRLREASCDYAKAHARTTILSGGGT